MKKLIFTVVIFLSPLLFSQNDSINKSTTTQEVERIIDKYGGQLRQDFNTLIEKTTPVAEEGFKIAVKKNIAEGVAKLLPLLFFPLFTFLFIKEEKRLSKKKEDEETSLQIIIYGVMSIFLALLALISTYKGILHVIAPEWYAIEDIINLIK